MLKKFLRWSWLRPIAKRILRQYGVLVVRELLEHIPFPEELQNKLRPVLTKLDHTLTPQNIELLRECLEWLQRQRGKELNDNRFAETIRILKKILELLN